MKLVDRQRGALTSQVSLCKGAHVILLGSSGHPRPPAFEGKPFALDETFIALEEVCARASLFVIQRVNYRVHRIGYNGFRLHATWTIERKAGRTVSGPVRSLGAFRQS